MHSCAMYERRRILAEKTGGVKVVPYLVVDSGDILKHGANPLYSDDTKLSYSEQKTLCIQWRNCIDRMISCQEQDEYECDESDRLDERKSQDNRSSAAAQITQNTSPIFFVSLRSRV